MSDIAIKVEHVSKEYRLGMIGGTTLKADLQRLWAKMRGKEDPTARIGTDSSHIGERFLALDDISFEVKQGEALGIIGHNGAGKSTLLKLLARVTAPTKGKISYNGRIASMLEVGTGFHGELSGRENIYMNGAILGMSKKEIDRKLDEIVAFAEMEQFIDTPVKRYSSGMYVKLAFAVAAHLDAEIMIMDEVLAVGDMKFQKKCLGRMNDAAHNEGRTVLFVSHNMGAVNRLCTEGLLLDHGKIAFQGKTVATINQYLSSGKMQLEDFCEEDDDKKAFQIIFAYTCDEIGKKKTNFSTEEKICLSLEMVAHQAVSGQVVSIRILDIRKTIVFTIDIALKDFFQGTNSHKALIALDSSLLMAGPYSWKFWIHMPCVEMYQNIDDVCCFAVHDTSTIYAPRDIGSYGVVMVDYEIDGRRITRGQ